MSNVIEILIYQIKKSFIPLIIFTILGIFIYGSDEFNFENLREEMVPLAYSQTCKSSDNLVISKPNPTSISSASLLPFDINIADKRTVIPKLLNITIEMDPINDPNELICYNLITGRHDVRNADGSSVEPSNGLKLVIKPDRLLEEKIRQADTNNTMPGVGATLDLRNDPIIRDIDSDRDGILNKVETLCSLKPPNNEIDCSRGSTKLTINGKDEKIIVGASAKNTNGFIIISEQTRKQPAEVECEKEKKVNYTIPKDTIIEIDCR